MESKKFFLLGCVIASSFHSVVFAGALDELNTADQAKVKSGELVETFEDVGKAWPKIRVYQKINASPEESAAVFSDYERHASYFSHITRSKISKIINKRTVEIDYSIKYIGLISEDYTVRDQISTYNSGAGVGDDSYQVIWNLVKAQSTQYSEGSARFEKLDNGTLLSYYSFVIPADHMSSSWGWVVDGAKKAVKDAVISLKGQIEKEKSQTPDDLKNEVNRLENLLAND